MTTSNATPPANSPASTVFSIEGQGLKLNTAEDVAEFVQQIAEMDNLKEIRLSGNTFGIEAAVAIAEALKKKSTIEYCYFSDMFTGRLKTEIPHALKAIGDALVDKPIKHFDLSDNAFGPTGAEPLRNFLSNNRSLETLKLNNNGLGIQGGTIVAQSLLACNELNVKEKTKSNLKTFIAGRNRLENGSMEYLSNAFKAHGSLVHVSMPQNGIRPEGIKTLMTALSECKDLEVLDLQDNTFTTIGSNALAESISSWHKLRKLHVGDCLLGKDGAISLFKALMNYKVESIEELHLAFNEIDEQGASLLSNWLDKFGGKVKLLELNGNCFDPEGDLVEKITQILSDHGHPNALDELDEMEWDEDDDTEDEDDEDEIIENEKPDQDVDELTKAMSKKLAVED
ncbi:hypothetical protein BKA69DRAFT_1031828 [Paraphysoderma sedebokerense]|nr:hypothetical protein BKA69DRAFT_1031828 [Paraphysoderma sedebokerense]